MRCPILMRLKSGGPGGVFLGNLQKTLGFKGSGEVGMRVAVTLPRSSLSVLEQRVKTLLYLAGS